MALQYRVQFSEEDFTCINEISGTLSKTIMPVPKVGDCIVRPNGLFQIADVKYAGSDGNYLVYFTPIVTQIEDKDIVTVSDKDRYYQFESSHVCGFKKLTVLNLVRDVEQLKNQLHTMEVDLAATQNRLLRLENLLEGMFE